MSDSALGMRRKIKSARDLKSVVRTMKAMASASIGQYEKSVAALGGYYDAIALGLGVWAAVAISSLAVQYATGQV